MEAFEHIRHLPGGEVLYASTAALFDALGVRLLAEIAGWGMQTTWLGSTTESPLRPQVVSSLKRLRETALEAAVAVESLSRLNRSAALNRALAGLTRLIADVDQTCPEPERPLVKQAAEIWRDILAKAAGEIGEIVVDRPVENPFIAGNPVPLRLFVGREDVFRCLEELWGSQANRPSPSVVLFGHRRMGKTSILQNLGSYRFGVETIVVYLTMQRLGRVPSTGAFLYALALELSDELIEARVTGLSEPREADYLSNAYQAFNRFLQSVRQVVVGKRVILTIDEFELIEEAIQDGRIELELLDFLRGVIQTESWLILALAGLHTLEEMTADYWNPLYASVTPLKVGVLSLDATAHLLANPSDDFPLDFTRQAVQRAYEWTHGQPYLTQLIGQMVVSRYNQDVFEAAQSRSSRIEEDDVDSVIASQEFYEQGSYYFNGIWGQAENSVPGEQTSLLCTLARSADPLTAEELFTRAVLNKADGQKALETLQHHDVITQNDQVDFTVPLMRRWVRMYKLEGMEG